MTNSESIEAEIEALWQSCFSRMQREPESRQSWKDTRQNLLEQNSKATVEGLQPWLAIFEFGLDWLAGVHVALNAENTIGPRSPSVRAPWVLIGSACAFGWSLRHACVSGFDTPARALLRTYVESLLLCIAILHEPSLGLTYVEADDDAKVLNFWHGAASPKNLHRKIVEIERNMGFESELVADLVAWRRREYEVLSQSSHLSYLAATMTCLPVSLGEEDVHRIGIVGRASANSLRTIDYAVYTTWYFSRMAYAKLIGREEGQALLVVDKDDKNHQAIVAGWDALATLFGKYRSADA